MAAPTRLDELLSRVFPDGAPTPRPLDSGGTGYCIPLPDEEEEEESWDEEAPHPASTAQPHAVVFFDAREGRHRRPEQLMEFLSDTLLELSELIPDLWSARGQASVCRTPWGGAAGLTLYKEDEELWDVHARLLLIDLSGGTALVFLSEQLDYTAGGPPFPTKPTLRAEEVVGDPLRGYHWTERRVLIRA